MFLLLTLVLVVLQLIICMLLLPFPPSLTSARIIMHQRCVEYIFVCVQVCRISIVLMCLPFFFLFLHVLIRANTLRSRFFIPLSVAWIMWLCITCINHSKLASLIANKNRERERESERTEINRCQFCMHNKWADTLYVSTAHSRNRTHAPECGRPTHDTPQCAQSFHKILSIYMRECVACCVLNECRNQSDWM